MYLYMLCIYSAYDGNIFSVVPTAVDVVVGDPVFYVHLLLSESSELEGPLGLCFQIHGESNNIYNLLTTPCTSVNGLWTAVTSTLNVITEISVSTVLDHGCHTVRVELESCTVVIDGDIILNQDGNYTLMGGMIVSRIDESLMEITVDNCKEPIVLAVECEMRRVYDHESKKYIETDMLKFSVRRPLAGRVRAHGLFGNSIIIIIATQYNVLSTQYYV